VAVIGQDGRMLAGEDLVGRQTESAQLSQLLTEDSERAVVITGEAGLGKTSLIRALSATAAADNWQVVQVLGMEIEQPFALGGLNQMVMGLQEYLPGLDDRDRTVLAPVFAGDPDAHVSALPLVMALLNLLTVAAQTRPTLLVIDDKHWLDRGSAEVLGAVGRRLTHPRVRVVAGRRMPHESVFTAVGWSEMQLRPLDAESSAQLLARAGVPSTTATKAAILAAAAGNPLALAD
jgi:predicted ATPase